jgi:DNA primase
LPFPALAAVLGLNLKRFKRRNSDWQGYCPIHQSKTNNNCFAYNDDGRYHCFSCNAKGRGGIDITMAVKGVNFTQACEILGAAPKEPAKQQKPQDGAIVEAGGELKPLAKDTWRKFAVPCPWLEQRITDAAVRERYGVFCYNNPARRSAYSGRVMLPVKDVEGKLFGYLGRAVTTEPPASDSNTNPKYLFPRNLPKSKFLFGAYELTAQLTSGQYRLPLKLVYLVESPFCVMKFAMLGLPAVSPFGWSVSSEQVDILARIAKGVVYIPDRNKTAEAGNVTLVLAARLWLRFPPLPPSIDDPEQMTKEQILAL